MSQAGLLYAPTSSQAPCDDAATAKDAEAPPRSPSAAGSVAEPVHERGAADGAHPPRPGDDRDEEEDEVRRLLGDIESIQVGAILCLVSFFASSLLRHLLTFPTIHMIKLSYRSLSVCARCWLMSGIGKRSLSSSAGAAATLRTTGGKGPSLFAPRQDGASVARK